MTEKESLDKINEFRNILNSKEKLTKNDQMKKSNKKSGQMSEMLNKIDDMDPWMKRKLEEQNANASQENAETEAPSGIEEIGTTIEKPSFDE